MAPKYKLIYFNARGRAELARFILAQAAIEYDDVRLEKDKWPEHKPKTPYGQLPVLEFEGKQLAQSYAICRYLAKHNDLIPKDAFEEALSDSIVNACIDVMDKVAPWARETDPQKKQEIGAKFLVETLPSQLEYLEKFITKYGKGYLIGDKLSWADLAVAGALHTLREKVPSALDKHPLIKAELDKVVNLPNIKAWIAKRPVTEH